MKTILLPKGVSEYTIVRLPDASGADTQYLLANEKLYELKSVKKAPKSIIFESEEGHICQSPELIVSSEFNLVYVLINSLDGESKRYLSVDNLIDQFEWTKNLPESMILTAASLICDEITEGDERFYRPNNEKIELFIRQKVEKVAEYLKQSSLVNQIKLNLYVASESEIPAHILDMELKFIADSIIGAYLAQDLGLFDFNELREYKKEINKKLMVLQAGQIQTSSKPKVVKKAVKAKKVVQKGKGALDMFFKKK